MSSRHLRRIRSKSVPSASQTDQDSREPANTVKTEEMLNNQKDEKPQSSKSLDPPERKSRRIGGELPLNFDYFEPCKSFKPPTQLPTNHSVLGRLKYLLGGQKGLSCMPLTNAINQVNFKTH